MESIDFITLKVRKSQYLHVSMTITSSRYRFLFLEAIQTDLILKMATSYKNYIIMDSIDFVR